LSINKAMDVPYAVFMSNAILATIGGDGEYLLTVHQHGDLGMG